MSRGGVGEQELIDAPNDAGEMGEPDSTGTPEAEVSQSIRVSAVQDRAVSGVVLLALDRHTRSDYRSADTSELQ